MAARLDTENKENSFSINSNITSETMDSSAGLALKAVKQPSLAPPANLTAARDAVQSPVQNEATLSDTSDGSPDEDFLLPKRMQASELVVLDGGGGTASSLQDSFKRFRKQKVKERKIMQMCKEDVVAKGPRTQEYKDNLRMKFIDQAKKYIGVPYSERYKNPDDPVAPLYLDCCGLVRKVLQDLGEEFGFLIGRWNQAYQLDTLPIRKEGVHELQPGDLIFYEGTYNSQRSKGQKHNSVHVEIFLGGDTGEATIGARYFKGTVKVFDSYKFPCTTWTAYKHHFCSIDTWLDGVCQSICPEHPWLIDSGLMLAAAAGKKSIFSEDSDDENAGGDFDEDVIQQFENDAASGKICGPCISSSSTEKTSDPRPTQTLPVPPTQISSEEELFLPNVDDSVEPLLSNSAPSSPSEKSKPVKKNRLPPGVEFFAMPAVSQSIDSSVSTKQPSVSSSISSVAKQSMKRPDVSKSVESVKSTSRKISSKVDCGVSAKNSGETYVTPSISANTAGAAEYIPPKGNGVSAPPNTYFVAKANGWRLVKAAMDKKGWQQLPFEYQFSTRFGLKWVERRSQIDYRTHQPGQLVCHIPNNEVITTKVGLLSTLRNKFSRAAIGSMERKPTPWLPETYQLDIPADATAALDADAKVLSETGKAPVWIYKPSCNNRGRGIRVVTGHENLREVCLGKPATSTEEAVKPSEGVIQRYLENPLLVPRDGESFKFDYRCYLLVARNDPSYMCFFHPGYCRLTTKPYDDSVESLSDPVIHLTNASLQKKMSDTYKDNIDFQVQSLEDVIARIESGGNAKSAKYLREEMHDQIKLCMADVIRASSSKFIRKSGFFDLFGLDFMVTLNGETFLLEANTNPALSLDNACLAGILPEMMDGCLTLVLGCQGPDRPKKEDKQEAADQDVLDNLPGKWELVHDENRKYWFTKPPKGKNSSKAEGDSVE